MMVVSSVVLGLWDQGMKRGGDAAIGGCRASHSGEAVVRGTWAVFTLCTKMGLLTEKVLWAVFCFCYKHRSAGAGAGCWGLCHCSLW